MKLYFSFTKKALVVVTALFCLGVFVFGRFIAAKNIYRNGNTNAKRIYFASSLGFDLCEEANYSKNLIVTEEISEKYKLFGYIGCQATVYNYDVLSEDNKEFNIVVYNGRIIGGDISPRNLT